MSLLLSSPQNKLNCWILLLILLMKDNACLNKVFIFLFLFFVFFKSDIGGYVSGSIQVRRDTPTLGLRGALFFNDREKHWEDVIMREIMARMIFVFLGRSSKLKMIITC